MHHVLNSSIGEKCTCGNPASHKVEEVFDFDSFPLIEDDILAATRHPLTVYLCCQCFSKLMGDPFDWCGLTQRVPDVMPCGHPKSAVITADEGTAYCGMCEASA